MTPAWQMLADLAIFDFELTGDEMETLSGLHVAPGDPSIMCLL